MLLKKKMKKLNRNSKGISSVIGTIFMVLLVLTMVSSVFLWTLYQNTVYNQAVRGQNQQELDVRNENVIAKGNYTVISGSKVSVTVNLTNAGPVMAQIVNLWVFDSSKQTYGFNNTFAGWTNMTLKAGQVIKFLPNNGILVTMNGGSTSAFDSFSIWFVTARGNSVPLELPLKPQTVINAMTAQGIGSIMMDFGKFWQYAQSSPWRQNPTWGSGDLLGTKQVSNYTASASKYIIIHATLQNMDPAGANIVLNGDSYIYMIGFHSGTVKFWYWSLLNVTNGRVYPNQPAQMRMDWGVPTDVYFYTPNTIGSTIDPGFAYPLNIIAYGTKGGLDYSQNIPFVALFLNN